MEKDVGEMVEVDATETIEQTDPVYDYQLDIDCNEMPITIDELSMGVSQHADICMETGNLAIGQKKTRIPMKRKKNLIFIGLNLI